MNKENIQFYNNVGVRVFKNLAQAGGFNTFTDMELIWPYIKNSRIILELGAGYGRCLDFFIHKKFKGKLIAVELSPKLAAYLKKKYKGKAEIIKSDIKNLDLNTKVDTALWMWSGSIDFSKKEQFETIQKIYDHLNIKGKLVLDIPKIGFQTIARHKDKQNLFFKSNYGTLKCYIANRKDMKEFAAKAGFSDMEEIDYNTATGKKRTLYILEK